MKNKYFISCCFLLMAFGIHLNSSAQNIIDSLQKKESIVAVPDAPAFNALGTQPSNILRPSDIRTIAVDMAPFIQGGKFTIPKSFALEVSPGALIYRDRTISIADYTSEKVFLAYNTTVSIGTGLDSSNGVNKIALGLRTTFINKGDKFLSAEHRAQIDNILMTSSASFAQDWTTFKSAHASQFTDPSVMVGGVVHLPTLLHNYAIQTALAGVDSNLAKQFVNSTKYVGNTQALINQADKDFENTHWNATRVDAALALVAVAQDSTGKNIKINKLYAWFTAALPLGTHGQVVLGAAGNAGLTTPKDSLGHSLPTPYQFSFSSRFYAGVNKYKFFSELQIGYTYGDTLSSDLTNMLDIGTELSIANIAWINLYGGFKNIGIKAGGQSASSGFVRFDFRLTLPDYLKFR